MIRRLLFPVLILTLAAPFAFAQSEDDPAPASAPAVKTQLKIFKLANLTPQEAHSAVQTFHSLINNRPQGVPAPAIAVDARAKSLYIRGTAEQIAEVEKLMTSIDQPVEKLVELKLASADIIPVKLGDIRAVQTVLSQLQIRNQIVIIGKGGFVIISKSDAAALAEAKEVVKSLDIADTTTKTAAAE